MDERGNQRTMKLASKIARIVLYIVGGFFILMSFDVFGMTEYSIIERVGGFFISSTPGIVLILLTIFLRKYQWILSILLITAGTFFIFFFNVFPDNLGVLFIVVLPMYICGGIFLVETYQNKQKGT